jgi:hypothetical protein
MAFNELKFKTHIEGISIKQMCTFAVKCEKCAFVTKMTAAFLPP